MPGLANVPVSDWYGTEVVATALTLRWLLATVNVAVATSWLLPGCAPAGGVTAQVVCADWPAATDENVEGEVAWTVQPAGAVSVTSTVLRVRPPVFVSVGVAVVAEPGVAIGAPLIANGWATPTRADPGAAPTGALMVAAPSPSPFITPPRAAR